MIASIIITLFILYTLACIADGPDVKPILNNKIGNYLHKLADKFYHAHYCHIDMCPFPRHFIDVGYNMAIPIVEEKYDVELVKHTVKLKEDEVLYFKNRGSNVNIIEVSKRICASAICKIIENRIRYSIDDDNPDGCVYITGNIVISKNK